MIPSNQYGEEEGESALEKHLKTPFPPHGTYGYLKYFHDTVLALTEETVPVNINVAFSRMKTSTPTLFCMDAIYTKNKTILTVSDGILFTRIVSIQPPPPPPDQIPASNPTDPSTLPTAHLRSKFITFSLLSLTKTPRGKYVILSKAFNVLTDDYSPIFNEITYNSQELIIPGSAPPIDATLSRPPPQEQPSSMQSLSSSSSVTSYPSSALSEPSARSSMPSLSVRPSPLLSSAPAHSGQPQTFHSSQHSHSAHTSIIANTSLSNASKTFTSSAQPTSNAPSSSSFFDEITKQKLESKSNPQLCQHVGETLQTSMNLKQNHPQQQSKNEEPSYAPQRMLMQTSKRVGPYQDHLQVKKDKVGDPSCIGINDLTVYVPKWTIKARVFAKSDIRQFNGNRGPGQVFHCDLRDKGGEIRATFFGGGVDRWYNVLEDGSCYLFSRGQIKLKNQRYNQTKHNYELTFDEKSSILPTSDQLDIPSPNMDLCEIKDINSVELQSTVNMIGVVSDWKPTSSITIKSTGLPKNKKELTIIDDGRVSINLTLWGEKCDLVPDEVLTQKPIVYIKNVRVGEWNGRQLSSIGSTKIDVCPSHPRAHGLEKWWHNEGHNLGIVQSLSNSGGGSKKDIIKTIEQIVDEASKTDHTILADKGIYFCCRGIVERVNDESFSWPACFECRKKMNETSANTWTCMHCNKTTDHPNHTYRLSVSIVDSTGSIRCDVFGEKAEEVIGRIKAEDLLSLREYVNVNEEGKSFADYFQETQFSEWVFRLNARSETYMDETKIKYRVMNVFSASTRVVEDTNQRLGFINNIFSSLNVH